MIRGLIIRYCTQAFPLATCSLVRLYLQYYPFPTHKLIIWEKIVEPYLRWYPRTLTAKLKTGSRLYGNFPDPIHFYSYFFGEWEPAITAYYKRILRAGDVVIDIGANVGAHALLAADLVGASGRVHAIEASPSICARLQRNIS